MPSDSSLETRPVRAPGMSCTYPPPKLTEPLPCPRCQSSNTKFCYYNNYNLSQPRHFCKSCRRYWTHGGTLRNVPIGGGSRKNHSSSSSSKRPRSSSSSSSVSTNSSSTTSSGPATTAANDHHMTLPMGVGTEMGQTQMLELRESGSFASLLNAQMVDGTLLALGGNGNGFGYGYGFDEMGIGFGGYFGGIPITTTTTSNNNNTTSSTTGMDTWQHVREVEGGSNGGGGGGGGGDGFVWPGLEMK